MVEVAGSSPVRIAAKKARTHRCGPSLLRSRVLTRAVGRRYPGHQGIGGPQEVVAHGRGIRST
jgi:hypothetical protein